MARKRKAEEPPAARPSSKKKLSDTRAYRKDPRRAIALKIAYVAVAGAWKPAMVELLNRTESNLTSNHLSPEVAALLTELEGQYDHTTKEKLARHESLVGMKRDELLLQSEAAIAAAHDEFRDRTRRAEEEMIAHGRVSIMKLFRKEHKTRLPPDADRHLTTLPNDPDIIKVQAMVNPTPRCRPRFYHEAETIWEDWRACTEAATLGPQPAPFQLPRSYREIMAARAAEEKEREIATAELTSQAGEKEKLIRRAGNLMGYVKSRQRCPEDCRWQGVPLIWGKLRDAAKEAKKMEEKTIRVRKSRRKGKGKGR